MSERERERARARNDKVGNNRYGRRQGRGNAGKERKGHNKRLSDTERMKRLSRERQRWHREKNGEGIMRGK